MDFVCRMRLKKKGYAGKESLFVFGMKRQGGGVSCREEVREGVNIDKEDILDYLII